MPKQTNIVDTSTYKLPHEIVVVSTQRACLYSFPSWRRRNLHSVHILLLLLLFLYTKRPNKQCYYSCKYTSKCKKQVGKCTIDFRLFSPLVCYWCLLVASTEVSLMYVCKHSSISCAQYMYPGRLAHSENLSMQQRGWMISPEEQTIYHRVGIGKQPVLYQLLPQPTVFQESFRLPEAPSIYAARHEREEDSL